MIRQAMQFYEFGPFRVDSRERLLLREGVVVPLTPKVFDTLLVLVENSGHILSKDELIRLVWHDTIVEEANLTRNISVLRRALGETPDENRYIETIPWRGYRFVAEVRHLREDTADSVVEERFPSTELIDQAIVRSTAEALPEIAIVQDLPAPVRSAPLAAGRRKSSPMGLISISAFILAFVAISFFVLARNSAEPSTEAAIRSIAVLPFRSLGPQPVDDYLQVGLADTLITRLGNIKQLIVRPVSSVRRYAEANQDPVAAGKELRVDAVLDANIHKSDGRIRVSARLINVRDGSSIWAGTFEERNEDLFRLQDSVVEKLAAALALRLPGEEQELLAKRPTGNTEAHAVYLKGRYHWEKWTVPETRKSIDYFQQAINLDPDFALAYAGLADAYTALNALGGASPNEIMPKAKVAVSRALELDDSLAEAHTTLGFIKDVYEWDFESADREFRRALALNPNSATAHYLYGKFLPDIEEKFDRAFAEFKLALELDRYSVGINKDLGETLYYAERYDEAIAQFQKTLQLEPNSQTAYSWLVRLYRAKGLGDDLLQAQIKRWTLAGHNADRIGALKAAYAKLGLKGLWREQLLVLNRNAEKGHVEPYFFAETYFSLGDHEQTLTWLEKACDARSSWAPTLSYDPLFRDLRSHPRFQRLLNRIRPKQQPDKL